MYKDIGQAELPSQPAGQTRFAAARSASEKEGLS
jgi:hypothetical protein